jgi:hypothetical protein
LTAGIRAVLFDFGGVILSSPIDGFRAYERAAGLLPGFLQRRRRVTDAARFGYSVPVHEPRLRAAAGAPPEQDR